MVTDKSSAWWDRQTKGFIFNQLTLRGVRFKEWDLTGNETVEITDPDDASTKIKEHMETENFTKSRLLKQVLKDQGEL